MPVQLRRRQSRPAGRFLSPFTAALALAICAPASPARANWIGKPSCNPYISTLSSALLSERVGRVRLRKLDVSFYPERARLPGSEGKAAAEITFALGRADAPVIYFLVGLGSASSVGYARYLMDRLNELGYSVVSIPSVFDLASAYGFSRYLRSGLTSVDVGDAKRLIAAARTELAASYGVTGRKEYLMGLSLGALQTAFVMADPLEQRRYGKFAMINPPLDIRYGLKVLDSFAEGRGLDEEERARASQAFASAQTEVEAAARLLAFVRTRGAADPLLRYVIGARLRSSVQDMVHASQDLRDDGLLTARSPEDRRREAKSWSIQSYYLRIAVPFYERLYRSLGRKLDLNAELTIWKALSSARRPEQALLLHSQDDFISNPADIARLKDYPIRSVITRCGGHIGALAYPEFMDPLASFLQER